MRSNRWAHALAACAVATHAAMSGHASAQAPSVEPASIAQLAEPSLAPQLKGLGTHHVPVSTGVPRAQEFFDQGLRLLYAFNHAEARRAFQESSASRPWTRDGVVG